MQPTMQLNLKLAVEKRRMVCCIIFNENFYAAEKHEKEVKPLMTWQLGSPKFQY